MSHLCLMATAGTVSIRSIPSEALTLYARAYAQFNLTLRNARHPGMLTRNAVCPECDGSVGGDLVATELLRLVKELEAQPEPLEKLAGSIETWQAFQARVSAAS